MTTQEKITDLRNYVLRTEGRLQQLKFDQDRLRSIRGQLEFAIEDNRKTAVSLECELESLEKVIKELEGE